MERRWQERSRRGTGTPRRRLRRSSEGKAYCAVDVTFRVTRAAPCTVRRPIVVTATEVRTTGEGETMAAATTMAVQGMADLLVETLGGDDTEAAMGMACAADVRTGLAGHPPYTMRVAIPKSLLAW